MIKRFAAYLREPVSTAPLAVFRIAFGALMCLSIVRFIAKGWVHTMYVAPKMFFPYYGFEWIRPLEGQGMYMVFAVMVVLAMMIMIGLFYRFSTVLFFLLFTYVELIDKTNYLNHYYFISLISFLIIFIPAGKVFSLDNILFRRASLQLAPRIGIFMLQLQLFVVYFFAGLAKVNSDWLLQAEPLRTWLPAFSHYPVIGPFMEADWLAFAFSWFGCIYDLCIGFLLFNKRTVKLAYLLVVVFHGATALFFNIGMFPYIMITITIIFFDARFHERFISTLRYLLPARPVSAVQRSASPGTVTLALLTLYFVIQFTLPLRYLFYKGDLFWTEQGYRFSWRVMLMEKAGAAFFTVRDGATGAAAEVDNREFLTYMQEKMMATQPDMLVDYARFLKHEYRSRGFRDPVVTAQCFVTVNGSGSREFVDPTIDLAAQDNSFLAQKDWVKSY